jgi:hypothetical protein
MSVEFSEYENETTRSASDYQDLLAGIVPQYHEEDIARYENEGGLYA